jgi:hypothetical protein
VEESPEYADLSAVWGEKGRSPYFVRHPVGKRNELVCCSRVTGPVVDLYTIPFGSPSWRLMRYSFTDMRESERCVGGSLILGMSRGLL